MQDFCRMFIETFKILILVTATATFCTIQCNADAVKVIKSNTKCSAEFSPKNVPHETDCSLFYVCLNGKAILKKCPPNLHFNKYSTVCDYPENVDCQKDSQEKVGRETDQQCPSENPDHPVLLPHKIDCEKFFMCDAGVPRLKSCQPGLHFNPALRACDYPENAGCVSGVNKKGKDNRDGFNVLCPLNEDGNPILIAHETDCRKFYTCSNGMILVHACQHGLHFNAERQACDYPENAGCKKGITKVPRGKLGKEIYEDKCSLEKDGKPFLVPHETDCRKFYSCNKGFPHLLKCQSGLHFNSKLQACDYPENVNCETAGVLRSVGVPSLFCPGDNEKTAIFYRHPSNCSVYYLCSNGLEYEFVCPARLHFNLRQKRCDYEDRAMCPIDSSGKNY